MNVESWPKCLGISIILKNIVLSFRVAIRKLIFFYSISALVATGIKTENS